MKKIFYIALGLMLMGCSTQKNTLLSRTYHNTTAKFNYLFNAEESYSLAEKKYAKEFPFSYSTQLPIFIFDNSAAPSKMAEGCDRAISKSGMLIKYHSITIRPLSGKQKTTAQRDFYNQQEYCSYVDDAYLIIGKSAAYQHEYGKARQAFQQVVANYPSSDSYAEAQLWLGLIAGAEKDLVQYYDALSSFTTDRKLSKQHLALYNAAWADYYIKKGNNEKAIEYLEKAADIEPKKDLGLRYKYILGQLYQQNNNPILAQKFFTEVAKKSPVYEMAFNAQLQVAMSYTSGNDPESLKKTLVKMASLQRNVQFRDQIYYAIGKIYLKDNNEKEALAYFDKSIKSSGDNSNQKGVTYYEIGQLALKNKDFLRAQTYYDSAANALSNGHMLYADASNRAKKLTRLATNIKEYQWCDSILRISALGPGEINRIIDQKIAALNAQAQKEQEASSQQRQYMMSQNTLSFAKQQSSSWYFYNQSTLAIGAAEFKMRWGTRKLEDNWRRKNKGTNLEVANTQTDIEVKPQEKLSPTSKEFYLKDIPKNEKEKEALAVRQQQALIEIADAYRADIQDSQSAIEALNKLMAEHPTDEQLLLKAYSIYYQAYVMAKDQENANRYRKMIVEKYPQSSFAQTLTSSTFTKGTVSSEHSKTLAQCIELMKSSNYKECLEKVEAQLANSDNPLLPQLSLLKAMAVGGLQGRDAYRKELSEVIQKFPSSEVATTAAQYLQNLDKSTLSLQTSSSSSQASNSSTSRFITSDGAHELIIIVPNKANINQLKFNLVSFNLESYPELDFSVSTESFDSENSIIRVKSFADRKKSVDYYYQLLEKQDLINQSGASNFALYVISPENLQKLMKDKSIDGYSTFFMTNYLK